MTSRQDEPAPDRPGFSRRSFIKSIGASATASTLTGIATSQAGLLGRESEATPLLGPGTVPLEFNINGKAEKVRVEPSTTLAQVLRYSLGMTGTKVICDRGACGGCSVIADGKLINSCMTLAADMQGAKITTIEGLAQGSKLDPVQESFLRHDALQCGYCTPGFIVATRVLLNDIPKPTLAQIKKALSGNICRCGTYTNIFNAALEASGQPVIMDQKGAV
ncbi:MAG: (2Fe-2S)-binding protein [Phycisphaerales bacterium]|nr:(2Fe-2S)-binding protein [Planctomycetota bacterium]